MLNGNFNASIDAPKRHLIPIYPGSFLFGLGNGKMNLSHIPPPLWE